jgi:putative aminopeptidase FrvX
MWETMLDLVKRLSETPGPSGQEKQVRELIIEELRGHCREIREDSLGNLIATVGVGEGYKVGMLAHMDEIGLIVTQISDEGLIAFELVGIIDARLLLGSVVHVMTSDGRLVPGVIGSKSRHLQTTEELGAKAFDRYGCYFSGGGLESGNRDRQWDCFWNTVPFLFEWNHIRQGP